MEANLPTAPSSSPRRRARRTTALALAAALGIGAAASVLPSDPAGAITFSNRPYLVSIGSDGTIPVNASAGDPAISGNGRFAAFSTKASLVPTDTNDQIDVYLRDRWAAEVELVSMSTDEVLGNGTSHQPSISDDGRYVAFRSAATVWGGPATNSRWNVWVRDRVAGTTVRASIGHAGDTIGADAEFPMISGNGRFVAFSSKAANIVAGDTNAAADVFVRDLVAKTNDRASVSTFEGQSLEDSWAPSISDDGRYVSFTSKEELAGGQVGAGADVFVRDRTGGSTANAHLTSSAGTPSGDAGQSEISGNGRYVAFASKAVDLVPSDTNGASDVFRRDLQTGTTVRVSVNHNGMQLGSLSSLGGISDDGALVAFSTPAQATAAVDVGNDMDVFVRGVGSGTNRRVSATTDTPDVFGTHDFVALSDAGDAVAFSSFVASGAGFSPLQPTNTQQVYVDAPLAFGPAATAGAMVDQQFTDFLGRKASSGELTGWQGRFLSGESHPAAMIAALSEQDAFAAKRAPVVRLYWAFFLRKPDAGGLNYWIAKYQNGASLASIAQKFAQSPEFKNRYGSVSNSQYLKLVYQNVFERQPDASGLAFWTGKLDRKEISRGQVLVNFSESSEGKRRLAPQVHLILIPLAMVKTVPTADFFAKGMAAFAAGEDEAAWVAQEALTSPAYAARFS